MRQHLMLFGPPGLPLSPPRSLPSRWLTKRLWPTLLLLALSPATALGDTPAADTPHAAPAPLPAIERGLDGAALSALLSADIAAQRGQIMTAVRLYLAQSERLDDAVLAERATHLARFTDSAPLVLEGARHWARLAPDDPTPRRILAGASAERGDWATAMTLLIDIEASGADAELIALVEEALGSGADPRVLETALDEGLVEHPGQPRAHLARALLRTLRGDEAGADEDLARARALNDRLPALWLVKSQVALERGRPLKALEYARQGRELAPQAQRFVLAQAQAHLALDDIEAAEAQFDTLLEQVPDNLELRLTLGRLYLQNDSPQAAWRLLGPAVEQAAESERRAELLMLAALASARADATERALELYALVPEGERFMNARAQSAQLLLAERGLEAALEWLSQERRAHPELDAELLSLSLSLLDQQDQSGRADRRLDEAIEAHPDDNRLLYVRAMRALARDDLTAMERDMTRLLERDPDNAEALNAWGYTLLQRTDRLDEALALIERAHRLEPDSPAILDSLGWALFKTGELDRALELLQSAWRDLPDEEVAAHLAEALWASGKNERARRLVTEALARFERHPTLDDLLARYPLLAPDDLEALDPSERPDTLENTP